MRTQAVHNPMRAFQQNMERIRSGHLLRDGVLFFAGVETVHTLSHIWWAISGPLPMADPRFPSLMMTPGLNAFAIVFNALVTASLVYCAHRLKP